MTSPSRRAKGEIKEAGAGAGATPTSASMSATAATQETKLDVSDLPEEVLTLLTSVYKYDWCRFWIIHGGCSYRVDTELTEDMLDSIYSHSSEGFRFFFRFPNGKREQYEGYALKHGGKWFLSPTLVCCLGQL